MYLACLTLYLASLRIGYDVSGDDNVADIVADMRNWLKTKVNFQYIYHIASGAIEKSTNTEDETVVFYLYRENIPLMYDYNVLK